MVQLNIILEDHGLTQGLAKKAGLIPARFNSLKSKLVLLVEDWVKRSAPVKTGKLQSGVTHQMTYNGGYVWSPVSRCKYVNFVIDGTRPHTIVPKKGQALYWPGAAHPVKKVRHPGTKSNPFYDKAYNNMQGAIDKEIEIFTNWLEEV